MPFVIILMLPSHRHQSRICSGWRGAGVQVVTDIFDGGSDKVPGFQRHGNIMRLGAKILVVGDEYKIRVIAGVTRHDGRLLTG